MNQTPRIHTRCPSCHNSTLEIHEGRLFCTWINCKDPAMIDRVGEVPKATDVWTYSSLRASLSKNGRFFAIVTPDGRNALSAVAAVELVETLTRGSVNNPKPDHEKFPPEAIAFLNGFYKAARATTEEEKIAVIRTAWDLVNSVVTTEGLKTLEFYMLTKLKLI